MSDSNDTDLELAEVVPFPGAVTNDALDNVGYLHVKPDRWCPHRGGILVNEQKRLVSCKECGAILDPFAYLLDLAKKRTILAGNVKALRDEEKHRRANIEKLAAIERNAKARIRRAEKTK